MHVGLEHRLNDVFSIFGRAARAFRTPDVDERVASGPAFDADFNPIPQNFKLKTQTSNDVELGYRIKDGPFQMQPPHSYKASISLIQSGLDFLTADDKEWLLRKTAERVFFG